MRTMPLAVLLCLAGAAFAQTNYVTSPPGFLTTEAGELTPRIATINRMCRWFGGYSNYECMIFDDHLRGAGIKFIKQIDFRSDGSFGAGANGWHTATSSMGRSWTGVTLQMSESRLAGPISKTYTLNALRTPTVVFGGTMNWPTVVSNSYARGIPNDWGVVKFPFSSTFVATGSNTVLQHYAFRGGTLTNGGAWSGTTGKTYLLDSHFNNVANTGYYYVTSTAQACVDSYHAPGGYSYAYVYSQTYADNPRIIAGDRVGKIWFDIRTYRTAPSRPVMWLLSVAGANIAFPPAACTNNAGNTITPSIYVDLTQGIVIPRIARFDGYTSHPASLTYNSAAVGTSLLLQGAWDDSMTGDVRLSRRARSPIAARPDGKLFCLFTNGSVTGVSTRNSAGMDRIPLARYTY